MHRKEMTHSDGSYEKKSRRRDWLTIWDKVKFPWYTYRLMHRKRVTCELHDSYVRLMTSKHAIPKIEWAIELRYNSVKTRSQWVGNQTRWWQDVVEKNHHPAEWAFGTPDCVLETSWWEDAGMKTCPREAGPRASGWAALENEKDKTLMAIRVGINIYCSSVRSPTRSHMQTLQ